MSKAPNVMPAIRPNELPTITEPVTPAQDTLDQPTPPKKEEATKIIPQKTEEAPIPASKPDELNIVCKTNKGTEDVRFKSGETIRFYYQVNRPCLMRIVYKLTDGRLILLENDRQIHEEEVGQFVELGDGYETAAPYGQESLYFFVQSEAFPKLNTRSEDGYTVILDDLPTSLRKTRGIKKKKYFAEYKIDLITEP